MNFSRDTTSGSEGLEVLSQLAQQSITTVLMTAWGNIELAVKGMQLGAADFIEKPWDNQKATGNGRKANSSTSKSQKASY